MTSSRCLRILPYWLRPNWKSTAITRLPKSLFYREAGEEPKLLLFFYFLFFILLVPSYYISSFIDEIATFIGVILLWGALFWNLAYRLASAILFPGSLSITSRRFEQAVAENVKRRVDDIARDIIRLASNNRQPQQLPIQVLHSCSEFLTSLSTSLDETKKRIKLNSQDAENCINSIRSLLTNFNLWKNELNNLEYKSNVISSAENVLSNSNMLMMSRKKEKKMKLDSDDEHEEEDDGEEENSRLSNFSLNPEEEEEEEEGQLMDVNLTGNKWKTGYLMISSQIQTLIDARRPFIGIISFEWARIHLEITYQADIHLLSSNSYKIDTAFLKPIMAGNNNNNNNSDKVVIMCNPNAARYEQYALHPFWMEFYRSRGMNVLIWNFRGYGRSEGSPSPIALKEDMENILIHLIEERKMKRICFHGESIGGIAACHGASILGGNSLLIADRTFASLKAVATALVGTFLTRLMELVTGWEADNVNNFLTSSTSMNRLILQDALDEIVKHRASLKVGIARKLFKGSDELFSKKMVHEFVAVCEQLVLAVNRPYFNSSIERVETCEGKIISFLPFPSEKSFFFLINFVKILFSIDAGHGEIFKKPFQDQIEMNKRKYEYSKSRIGKLFSKKKKEDNNFIDEDNFVWDWFACSFIFGRSTEKGSRHGITGLGFDVAMKMLSEHVAEVTFPSDVKELIHCCMSTFDSFSRLKPKDDDDENATKFHGILTALRCGHNGSPTKQDLIRVEQFLENAGWNT